MDQPEELRKVVLAPALVSLQNSRAIHARAITTIFSGPHALMAAL